MIGLNPQQQVALAGGFQARRRAGSGQTEDSQASAIAHFRVRLPSRIVRTTAAVASPTPAAQVNQARLLGRCPARAVARWGTNLGQAKPMLAPEASVHG